MSNNILVKSLVAIGLLIALSSASVGAAPFSSAHADPGVINREQILYWLIKRGELDANASEQQKAQAVDAFVLRAFHNQPKTTQLEADFERKRLAKLSKEHAAQAKAGSQSRVMAVNAASDSDVTKTVKVLAVLIDFPDLPYNANRLSPGDTDMYYSSYPASHYQNLLFSTTGVTGPSGQNLISAYQYYQAVSGQSFYFTGGVKGWVRADNNADYYGANVDDSDKAAEELVIEAVTKAVASMSADELASYDVEDQFDLDGDGNLEEPDGVIDHFMVFHSSVGEEAGGGVLGDDAIWSHRSFVSNTPISITGSSKKLFGYTIQPIDAAVGVCTHEFGHDLGLPDEYDTNNSGKGSPVGKWSLMSGGSWAGNLAGTQPSGFSPYARSYLQDKYKGRWVNETKVNFAGLSNSSLDLQLNSAVNMDKVNQISIPLPVEDVPFYAPIDGDYQYYSGKGNLINNAMSFDFTLPAETPLSLTMQAHWNIEEDYDYMQVMVDSVVLAGNHTKASNSTNAARNIITGNSGDLPAATGADHWVELEYDLSAYAGRSVTISVVYKTDEAVGDYGIVIDKLAIKNNDILWYSDSAELENSVNLAGFSRISDSLPGQGRRYILQLRNQSGIDGGLSKAGYNPGVLVWLENLNFDDNNVSDHPGYSLIGVIDADQNILVGRDTEEQIHDAAFSMNNQKAYAGDNHLTAISLFDDSLDYSAPLQPESGMVLSKLGFSMEVISQESDNSSATVALRKSDGSITDPLALAATIGINSNKNGLVSFSAAVTGGEAPLNYQWEFGVLDATSNEAAPSYQYTDSGQYVVVLEVTDAKGDTVVAQTLIDAVIQPVASFEQVASFLDVVFTNTSSGGFGELTYAWTFGDGSSSTSLSPSHSYSAAGSYTVTLVVTDTKGNTATQSRNIVVTAVPTAATSGSSDSGGSLAWLSLLCVTLFGFVRRRV